MNHLLCYLLLVASNCCFEVFSVYSRNKGEGGDRYSAVRGQFNHSWQPNSRPSDESVYNDERIIHRLMAKLMRHYNKEAVIARPVVIHFDILLLQVKNTIEREGIIESVIALIMDWRDMRMTWNPSNYGGLTFLSLSTNQVWLPDIAMTNSAEHLYRISRDSLFTVRVSYNGMFKFVPTGTAKTWCDLKLLTFPFDIQQCSLEFESWSLDSTTMTFDGKSELVIDESFASAQFYLCDRYAETSHHTYSFTGETFTRVRFYFTMKRKGTFYVINIIFPLMILSFIQVLTFLIPCREINADRIAFGTTNLLTLVVYQTIITEQMPKSSDAVTALSKYVMILMTTSAAGIFESVIVERLQSRTLRPPPFALMRLLRYVPVLLREIPVNQQAQKPMTSTVASSTTLSPEYARQEVDKGNSLLASEIFCRSESYRLAQGCDQLSKSSTGPQTPPSVITSESTYSTPESSSKLNVTKSLFLGIPKCKKHKRPNILIAKPSFRPSAFPSSRKTSCSSCGNLKTRSSPFDAVDNASLLTDSNKKIARPCQSFESEYYREWIQTSPSCLWAELAFKMDFLTFAVCATAASISPFLMFLPPLLLNGACNLQN